MKFFNNFKKSEISFNKKLTAKEVVNSIKSGNYKYLKKLFPRIKAGKKRFSRTQTFCFFGIMFGIGIVLSKILNNPFPFFLFLTIAFGSEYVFNEATTSYITVALIDTTHFVVCYQDIGNSNKGTAIIGTISDEDVIAFGSEYVFNEATTSYITVALIDTTHFVVCYQDVGNSNKGTAIIGTISNGDEISYGSEYLFNDGAVGHNSVVLLDSTHIVVTFRDWGNSSKGTATIGTISSGDVITFGLEYIFNEGETIYQSAAKIDSIHFVVCYQDKTNNYYGTAIIGTISNGDEISYGSEYVYNPGNSTYQDIALIDSTHFVIIYADAGNGGKGTAIIGTISDGDVIAYGSEYIFENTDWVTNYLSVVLRDDTHFVVCYVGSSSQGTAIIGTISNGDEIAFGSEYVFNEATTSYITVALIDTTHFVVCYQDIGNSNKGTAIIGTFPDIIREKTIQAKTRIQITGISYAISVKTNIKKTQIINIQAKTRTQKTETKSIQAKIRIKQNRIKTVQAKTEIHLFVEYFYNTNYKNELTTTADWDTVIDKCRLSGA